MSGRRVVVVGSGGREHALAARLAEPPDRCAVLVVPGNDGIGLTFERRAVDERDLDRVAAACEEASPDLVVVGPDAALAGGLADRLIARGIRVFGPVAAAARLEWSKAFAKDVMAAAGVPTAEARAFESPAAAESELDRWGPTWVIKADGLAAGKGVTVTSDRAEAIAFLHELDGGRFGDAGRRVLLERFLDGEELSVMAVCDGERAVLLPAARDYKRARDGDAGPNTGGMGAFAPTSLLDPAEEARVRDDIVLPVLGEMRRRGTPYRGVLYFGLMRAAVGFRVVEINSRFGDPETQVVLPLVEGSLAELLAGAASGRLDPTCVSRRAGAALAVAVVQDHYPAATDDAGWIVGLESLKHPGVEVRYAGARRGDGGFHARGRAAYVVATAASLDAARASAYAAIGALGGRGWRCRRDIGSMLSAAITGGSKE